ncbi:uncharacterized protein LOC111286320 [Durio zibethinus]|uniref:Uncharacterized protein LOC111286320 n=1 Tax=Durio zibethinus TaxID=66656 RepID=A0A6P5XUT2_DURZI|nr:uncharacterized protein LOC111286320 [Durio zibethinus]
MATSGGFNYQQIIEELEVAVATLKAYVVTNDRLREIETTQRELSDTLHSLSEEVRDALNVLQKEFDELRAQVSVLQLAMTKSSSSLTERGKKAKVPKPRCYERAKNAKELGNFLFDIK